MPRWTGARDRVGPLLHVAKREIAAGAVTASLERISADGADANAAGMALWNEAADQLDSLLGARIERFAAAGNSSSRLPGHPGSGWSTSSSRLFRGDGQRRPARRGIPAPDRR